MRRALVAAIVASAVAAIAAPGPAWAAPWKLTMEGGAEADSNVKQTETAGSMTERIAAPVARAGARIEHRGSLLAGSYMLGLSGLARLAARSRASSENAMLYAGDARWLGPVAEPPASILVGIHVTGAEALAFAGGTGPRTFRYLGGDGVIAIGGSGDRRLVLAIGGRAFTYKPNQAFTWRGPVGQARLDMALWQAEDRTRSLELAATLAYEARGYDSHALRNDCPPDAPPAYDCATTTALVRRDRYQRAGVELNWTAGVIATASYQLTVIDSNSYGQSLIRHRVIGSATTELIARLFATATITLQLDQYPDGVLVEKEAIQEVTTLEDENRSSLQIRLARELTAAWSLEARLATWREFGNADTATYRRELIYAGVVYAR